MQLLRYRSQTGLEETYYEQKSDCKPVISILTYISMFCGL